MWAVLIWISLSSLRKSTLVLLLMSLGHLIAWTYVKAVFKIHRPCLAVVGDSEPVVCCWPSIMRNVASRYPNVHEQ